MAGRLGVVNFVRLSKTTSQLCAIRDLKTEHGGIQSPEVAVVFTYKQVSLTNGSLSFKAHSYFVVFDKTDLNFYNIRVPYNTVIFYDFQHLSIIFYHFFIIICTEALFL
jgi:hypothetical protein